MSCPLHTTPQTWCRECTATAFRGMVIRRECVHCKHVDRYTPDTERSTCEACGNEANPVAAWVCDRKHEAPACLDKHCSHVLRPDVPATVQPLPTMAAFKAEVERYRKQGPRPAYVPGDAYRDRIEDLEAEVAALQSQLASESRETQAARLAAAHDSLRAVLAIVARTGGYMSPEDQQTMRDARAEVA